MFSNFNQIKTTLLILCFSLPTLSLLAQVNHNNINNTYTQNFNTLISSGSTTFNNNTTLTGWYAAWNNTSGGFTLQSGTGSSGAANLYSFGSSGNSDRALGSVGTNGNDYAWALRMKNNTGQTVRSVQVTFTGEQWRASSDPEEQLMSFSYLVSSNAITTLSANETGYSKVPYLNFISPVFPGAGAIDGNAAANRYQVNLRFNVDIPNGHEIMLKWFDRNDPDADHGLAIDDVSVKFFNAIVATDQFNGNTTLSRFMKGIIFDIPDEGSGAVFNEPTSAQITTWNRAVTALLNAKYDSARIYLASNNVGYRCTRFTQGVEGNLPARTYYVFSKDGAGVNHWGTYVFSTNGNISRPCLAFEAPHPLHDAMTGEQSTYLFRQLDGFLLAVSGAHRCLDTTPSGCAGSSGPCRQDGLYTISDPAHNAELVFQSTTQTVAALRPNQRFIQMHGFGQDPGDPFFIISNGTRQTPAPDWAVQLRDALLAVPLNNITPVPDSAWSSQLPHINTSWNKLIATTNVQGRLLNNYANGDICSGTTTSTTVSGRFLHVEQYNAARTNTANYPLIRDAFAASGICNCNNNLPGLSGFALDRAQQANVIEARYNGNGAATLELRSSLHEVRVSVIDAMGRIHWENTVDVNGTASIPMQHFHLPAGVYFATGTFDQEKITVKFIVP